MIAPDVKTAIEELRALVDGASLVIINRDPTEVDELADLVVRHDIGEVLEPFIAA